MGLSSTEKAEMVDAVGSRKTNFDVQRNGVAIRSVRSDASKNFIHVEQFFAVLRPM